MYGKRKGFWSDGRKLTALRRGAEGQGTVKRVNWKIVKTLRQGKKGALLLPHLFLTGGRGVLGQGLRVKISSRARAHPKRTKKSRLGEPFDCPFKNLLETYNAQGSKSYDMV